MKTYYHLILEIKEMQEEDVVRTSSGTSSGIVDYEDDFDDSSWG